MATSERTCFRSACLGLSLFFLSILISSRSAPPAPDLSMYADEAFDHPSQQEARVRAQWPFMRKKLLEAQDVYKSVFLFGYMRGGTTLVDRLVSQDERVTSWYEPLTSLYGYLYALQHPRIHSSVIYDQKPDYSIFRPIKKWEMDHIVDFFTNLFSCNLKDLPTEFLSSAFAGNTVAIQNFITCYKLQAQYMNTTSQLNKIFFEGECYVRTGIAKYCEDTTFLRHQSVANSIMKHCDHFLEYTRALVKLKGSPHDVTPEFLAEQILSATGHEMSLEQAATFIKHQICINRIGQIVRECSESTDVEELCKRRIRMAKVLRIKMPNMEPIIQAVPNIYLVHYVRDPRAIMRSRMLMSQHESVEINVPRWEKMTGQLCDEMLTDILAAEKLNRTYPGVIKRIRYEDIVLHPELGLQQLYGSFDETHPPELLEWLQGTMHASRNGPGSSVVRSNGTRSVDQWRHELPRLSVEIVNSHPECKQVLATLGYKP